MLKKEMFRLTVISICVVSLLLALGGPAIAKDPVNIPGSSWDTIGKGKSSGAGKSFKSTAYVDIFFGPQSGLNEEEFLATINDGYVTVPVTGTYYLRKGKLKGLKIDLEALEDELQNIYTSI